MLIHHGQYIFIIYDSACQLAEKKTIFKLSKLIELKFISTTWPHYLNLTSKVAHQQDMPKAISDHTKSVRIYISLAPC